MAIFKCKMCGGTLEVNGESVIECDYCGTAQTVPTAEDEKLRGFYNRANTLRLKGEFDKAEELYEKILQADGKEAEAHWGVILCRFGIEYVEDPQSGERIPTCHRTSFDSVMADEDYKAAVQNADSIQRELYEKEAKEIDRLQKEILSLSEKEEPYDVFICYKETDENGKRTQDSVIANDIYYQLTGEGYKVFYAAITLEDKLGSAYEPCIFAALNSAKVMLAMGTKPEYFQAVWVKNEWSRYLKMMKNDRSKMLIPCYRDMDAYELPEEFSHLQAQDMSKIGFINDIVRGIKKVIVKEEEAPAAQSAAPVSNTAPLLERAFMFLEDGEWEKADDYCEQVLNLEPKNAEAYLGKLMAAVKVSAKEELANLPEAFGDDSNYQKILRFGDEALVNELKGYVDFILARNEKAAQEANAAADREAEEVIASIRYDLAQRGAVLLPIYESALKELEASAKEIGPLSQKIAEEEAKLQELADLIHAKTERKNSLGIFAGKEKRALEAEIFGLTNNKEKLEKSLEGNKSKQKSLGSKAEIENKTQRVKAEIEKRRAALDSVKACEFTHEELYEKLGNSEVLKAVKAENPDLLFDFYGRKTLYAFDNMTVAIKDDETIVSTEGRVAADLRRWKDIVFMGGSELGVTAMKKDGTVVDAGSVIWGMGPIREESGYSRIFTNGKKIVCLKEDGEVLCAGPFLNLFDARPLCQKGLVVDIQFDEYLTAVLYADGTVALHGTVTAGMAKARDWHDIAAIELSYGYILGLKKDGTVVVASVIEGKMGEVTKWKNIIAISSCYNEVVGLKADGTVVSTSNGTLSNVSNWKNMVAVSTGLSHTVGLKADGTVVAVGSNSEGQCEVANWKDIMLP